jgi:hypothetical protein
LIATGHTTGGSYGITATTQVDRIYLSSRITANQFFADSELVLHEYYHVVRQWNTGALNNFRYLINPSRWEQPAMDFGRNYRGLYESYLGGP